MNTQMTTDPQRIVLETFGLSKTYFTTQPPTPVLNGIDLDVRAGEFIAVMGASGSGKSTLLYSMSGMDAPTSGTVLFEGRDLIALTDTQKSRVRLTDMGFVFQQAYFLEGLSVRDNILLPALKAKPRERQAVEARVDALLKGFAIHELADHGISQVSGGQLQRAAICRALVTEPKIVFADEPTGALNTSAGEEVMDILGEVRKGGTSIVMVTHNPACAARADRVVYLRDGLVVDELAFGRWHRREHEQRETALLHWLSARGF